ncbi:MAG: hypothetical protein LBI37_03185 [Puniceicoccales bacterium]|nr:hypothetical protein [Puniceicoccales bacterium]
MPLPKEEVVEDAPYLILYIVLREKTLIEDKSPLDDKSKATNIKKPLNNIIKRICENQDTEAGYRKDSNEHKELEARFEKEIVAAINKFKDEIDAIVSFKDRKDLLGQANWYDDVLKVCKPISDLLLKKPQHAFEDIITDNNGSLKDLYDAIKNEEPKKLFIDYITKIIIEREKERAKERAKETEKEKKKLFYSDQLKENKIIDPLLKVIKDEMEKSSPDIKMVSEFINEIISIPWKLYGDIIKVNQDADDATAGHLCRIICALSNYIITHYSEKIEDLGTLEAVMSNMSGFIKQNAGQAGFADCAEPLKKMIEKAYEFIKGNSSYGYTHNILMAFTKFICRFYYSSNVKWNSINRNAFKNVYMILLNKITNMKTDGIDEKEIKKIVLDIKKKWDIFLEKINEGIVAQLGKEKCISSKIKSDEFGNGLNKLIGDTESNLDEIKNNLPKLENKAGGSTAALKAKEGYKEFGGKLPKYIASLDGFFQICVGVPPKPPMKMTSQYADICKIGKKILDSANNAKINGTPFNDTKELLKCIFISSYVTKNQYDNIKEKALEGKKIREGIGEVSTEEDEKNVIDDLIPIINEVTKVFDKIIRAYKSITNCVKYIKDYDDDSGTDGRKFKQAIKAAAEECGKKYLATLNSDEIFIVKFLDESDLDAMDNAIAADNGSYSSDTKDAIMKVIEKVLTKYDM